MTADEYEYYVQVRDSFDEGNLTVEDLHRGITETWQSWKEGHEDDPATSAYRKWHSAYSLVLAETGIDGMV